MRLTLGAAAYGAARLEARLGRRRAGPGPPESRPLPLGLPDPVFLLVLMMSSRDMLNGSDMFG